MGSLLKVWDFFVCGNGFHVLSCGGTVAGPVTGEEPLCVEGRRSADFKCFFFPSPWQEEIFHQLWWEILGGRIKILQLLTGSVTHTPTLYVRTQRGRAKYSAELIPVLTGDNNTRREEDQKQNN